MSSTKAEIVHGSDDAPSLGGTAIAHRDETAVSASAAQARAAIEARFLIALHRPRDWDDVRARILKDCQRPRFAGVARYRRPVGKAPNAQGEWVENFIEGPSIRFAEAAIRSMGNLDQQTHTIFDSDEKRVLRVEVTDLETNATYSKELTLAKSVERRKLKRGQKPIGTRVNSYGDTVYIVPASEGELTAKQDAEISKALRTLSLRLLPGDILDEAMDQCVATAQNEAAQDPDALRKRMIDSFGAIGVQPSGLRDYLGHELSTASPAQLNELRDIYAAVRDGYTTWAEVAAVRKAEANGADDDEGASVAEKLKRGLQQKIEAAKAAKAKPAQAESDTSDEEAGKA